MLRFYVRVEYKKSHGKESNSYTRTLFAGNECILQFEKKNVKVINKKTKSDAQIQTHT